MAEHTDEEDIDHVGQPPLHNAADNSNVPELTEATHVNQETSNMEVHHHGHHDGRKNWKSYFWEFLMLFLAVFCGFLAEYKLEHVIEHNREKQFVSSFVEDLESDTTAIRTALNFRYTKMQQMDSFMILLKTQNIKGHERELYYFGRMLVRSIWFQSNDRTITQLKNSGGMRLIRNEQAVDSIIAYQKLVELVETNYEDDRIERYNAFPLISRIFSPYEFDQMLTIDGISRPVGNPPLRSYDPAHHEDLAFWIHQLKGSTYIIEKRLNQLNNKAINTMVFLKKEYHLE